MDGNLHISKDDGFRNPAGRSNLEPKNCIRPELTSILDLKVIDEFACTLDHYNEIQVGRTLNVTSTSESVEYGDQLISILEAVKEQVAGIFLGVFFEWLG